MRAAPIARERLKSTLSSHSLQGPHCSTFWSDEREVLQRLGDSEGRHFLPDGDRLTI
jgi:hypothetical protein